MDKITPHQKKIETTYGKLTNLVKSFYKKVADLGIGDGDDENKQLIEKELSKLIFDSNGKMIDGNKDELETKVEENRKSKGLTEEEAMALTKKQIEDADATVISGDGVEKKLNEEVRDEISPDLLAVLEHIKEFFNLSSINDVLAYLITIADVLANDEDLAKMVLLEAKNQDGTLSEKDLASLMTDIQAVNSEVIGKDQDDNTVLEELVSKSGLPVEKIDSIAGKLRADGQDAVIADPNAFLNHLANANTEMLDSTNNANKALDAHLEEGDVARNTQNISSTTGEPVKFKVISLSKKNSHNKSKSEPKYGSDWITSVISGLQK